MNAKEVLATLKKLGKPQIAAIYRRHGSGANVFGVLTSDIAKFQRRIGVDHALAMRLWKSGNAEARILALQIADPQELTEAEADAFIEEVQSPFLSCYLSSLVARSPIAKKTMRAWMKSPREFVRENGYGIFALLLKSDSASIPDSEAKKVLQAIEKQIHGSANFARYAMNAALISIGVHKPGLRKQAAEAARRIGKVHVDHGETSCKTPDAVSAIERVSRHRYCP